MSCWGWSRSILDLNERPLGARHFLVGHAGGAFAVSAGASDGDLERTKEALTVWLSLAWSFPCDGFGVGGGD